MVDMVIKGLIHWSPDYCSPILCHRVFNDNSTLITSYRFTVFQSKIHRCVERVIRYSDNIQHKDKEYNNVIFFLPLFLFSVFILLSRPPLLPLSFVVTLLKQQHIYILDLSDCAFLHRSISQLPPNYILVAHCTSLSSKIVLIKYILFSSSVVTAFVFLQYKRCVKYIDINNLPSRLKLNELMQN